MLARVCCLLVCLLSALLIAQAEEMNADLFAETPAPGPGELIAPRSIVADAATNCCYVLDAGANHVVGFTPAGGQKAVYSYDSTFVNAGVRQADPLLPQPALAVAGGIPYLLILHRDDHLLDVQPLSPNQTLRTIKLPENAAMVASTLDSAGRVLIAYLRMNAGKLGLAVARETDDNEMTTVMSLENVTDLQAGNVSLTGFAVTADGRIAVGLAQAGTTYSFVRSWLVQGVLHGDTTEKSLEVTCHPTLIDARGRLLDRYRPMAILAGNRGYALKPCVPLFTALVFGPQGTIISGGHTLDPFLRVYADGHLLHAQPRLATGGQHLAALADKDSVRLFGITPRTGRVEEYALDGRVLGELGKPIPFSLAQPIALAANAHDLYAIVAQEEGYRLLQFSADGHFRWAEPVSPPKGMEHAKPFLATPTDDRVYIGWRQPNTAGLGWVDCLLADGTAGLPLWSSAYPAVPSTHAAVLSPSPLLASANGGLYLLRETIDGTVLQTFSAFGAPLQQLPAGIKGVSAISADGSLAWAHFANQQIVIDRYTRAGLTRGRTLLPREANAATVLLPARGKEQWGWLTSTNSLLQFDQAMNVVDETTVFTPENDALGTPLAIAGDGNGRIYFACPNHIYMLQG